MGRWTFDSTWALDVPDWALECALCGSSFAVGDQVDVVALMPDDDNNLNKMLDGKAHTSQGCFAHSECVVKQREGE
jgi:hypothetical protein